MICPGCKWLSNLLLIPGEKVREEGCHHNLTFLHVFAEIVDEVGMVVSRARLSEHEAEKRKI